MQGAIVPTCFECNNDEASYPRHPTDISLVCVIVLLMIFDDEIEMQTAMSFMANAVEFLKALTDCN